MIRRAAFIVLLGLVSTSCAALGLTGACDGTELIASFEQVGDLVEAGNVQSADVKIGSITEIELDESDWTAQVTMCLNKGERIPEDSEAIVRTTSLLGEKFVDLHPNSIGGPYFEDGDILDIDQTSKATELEDVFASLAQILGTGNLEEINRFTAAQAKILGENSGELRDVLGRLRQFTDTLVGRKGDIASSIDSLDDVSRFALGNTATLQRFLESFGEASGVLADQKEGLQQLLVSLDRFTQVSIRLLDATDEGLTDQFGKLRPVLRTVVANSGNLEKAIKTLATFSDWFPETMPGDYLQLDVCQALETTTQGTSCPQSDKNDDETATTSGGGAAPDSSGGDLKTILRVPLRGKN